MKDLLHSNADTTGTIILVVLVPTQSDPQCCSVIGSQLSADPYMWAYLARYRPFTS